MYPEFTIEPFGRYDRKQQQSLLNINGDGTLEGSTEIQVAPYSGLRSNVFVPSSNSVITLSLADDFNSGATQLNTVLDLETTSDAVTHEVGDTYSWPTGDLGDASLPDGWDYIPGNGSGSTSGAVEGRITNNTGSAVSVDNSSVSVTINITSLPADGTTAPTLFVRNGPTLFVDGLEVVSAIGSYTFTDTDASSSTSLLNDGESLDFYIFESTEADQGFTYTVTDVEFNTGGAISTFYVLDIDTSDSVFSGNISSSLSNDLNATEAVTEISTDITNMFPSITAGAVYDGLAPDSASGINDYSTRQITGAISFGEWDLRNTSGTNGISINYSTWDDWDQRFFGFGSNIGSFRTLFNLALSEGNFSNMRLTVIDNSDSSIGASFNVSMLINDSGRFFQISSIISQSGVPGTGNVTWDLFFTADIDAKAIDLDTNQMSAISQLLTLTPNTGRDVIGEVSSSDGIAASGQPSTYMLTDPYGVELVTFTSFVSSETDTDVASVISTIVSAINNNIETPIDFIASSDASEITITAQAIGSIPTTWTVSVNNHGQLTNPGNIVIGPVLPSVVGSSISVTLSGGGLSSDVVVNGSSLTKDQIIEGLITNISTGATIYDDVDADLAFISTAFDEQPELEVVVAGDTNNTLTFDSSVKYWGHT